MICDMHQVLNVWVSCTLIVVYIIACLQYSICGVFEDLEAFVKLFVVPY